MNYHKVYIPNSFVHIIIASYERKHIFIDNIEILRTAFKNTMQNYKFEIVAICVLPDHIHLILNPENIVFLMMLGKYAQPTFFDEFGIIAIRI